jgi:hypothetical protein
VPTVREYQHKGPGNFRSTGQHGNATKDTKILLGTNELSSYTPELRIDLKMVLGREGVAGQSCCWHEQKKTERKEIRPCVILSFYCRSAYVKGTNFLMYVSSLLGVIDM